MTLEPAGDISRFSLATLLAQAKPMRCFKPPTPPSGEVSTSSPGYIEPHERPATAHLAQGLENVPCKLIEHNGIALSEFDLDTAIERAPQLILVDELAHTNAPGSRHDKRYQDVEELLHAGIDVYTTVNVQHIESLNDMVASITGVVVSERIPDRIFDDADQVELVDIEPEDLLERLRAGLVYRPRTSRPSATAFFYRREPHCTPRNRAAPLRRSHRPPHRCRTRAGKP